MKFGNEMIPSIMYAMQTFILDASQIDSTLDADQFLAKFYNLPFQEPALIRSFLYSDETLRITKVFNWPSDAPNWVDISLLLEVIQQRSPYFYLIWGPEQEKLQDDQDEQNLIDPELQPKIVDKIKL